MKKIDQALMNTKLSEIVMCKCFIRLVVELNQCLMWTLSVLLIIILKY